MLLETKRRSRRAYPGMPKVDRRTVAARRFRDICRSYELEAGGEVTAVERDLIAQAAGLVMRAEQMQAALIRGEPVCNDELVRVSSTAKRLLETIRTKADKRQAASGQDPLAAHIAAKYGNRSETNPEVDIEDEVSEEIAAAVE